MPDTQNRIIGELMEQLIAQRPGGMATVFTRLFNLAMRFEREDFLGARHYERSDGACQDFRVWPELLNIFRSLPL